MEMHIPDRSEPAGKAASTGALARLRRAERGGERLRWGLTGLAAIFLIVMLAAARLGQAPMQARPGTGELADGEAGAGEPGAGEPLAVLGVAPGPATRPPEPR